MTIDMQKEIDENQVVLVIVPNDIYLDKVTELTKALAEGHEKTVYVSLNKPYTSLVGLLHKNSIDPNKFYFIDAVTSTVMTPEPTKNCDYVSNPGALTELGLHISKVLTDEKPDATFFDSLSTLLVYEKGTTVIKFVHALISKLRVLGGKCVLTCLEEDVDSTLIKDLNMFADKVINLGRSGKGMRKGTEQASKTKTGG